MTIIDVLMAGAAAATEATAAESGGGLPQMDFKTYPSQIFWLAVTFGLLYWMMSTIILPRLGGAIETRRDRIAADLDRAAESRREATEAEAAYGRALADARAKAQGIAADTRTKLNADIAAMQASMEKDIAGKTAAAETRIAAMKRDAALRVKDAAADTTKSVVEALIQETPVDDIVRTAVSRAMEKA